MTSVSMMNQFPTNSISTMSPASNHSSKPCPSSTPTKNWVKFAATKSKPRLLVSSSSSDGSAGKKLMSLGAGAGDEGGIQADTVEMGSLKKQLVDSFNGTNLGLSATSETRAEIVELITELEVLNPTPEPTKSLPLLNGKWILAYTSCVALHTLLSSGTLPLVKVDELSQTIDSEDFTVQNCVVFAGLGSTTAISANATFEIQSPKRVQMKFDEGIIGTPQLTDSIKMPESIEVLGQKVDLSPFKGLITSVEDTASHVAKTISSHPPWKYSVSQGKVESWLLTTYLDQELRISRGDGGKVFVLFKEGSPLLSS